MRSTVIKLVFIMLSVCMLLPVAEGQSKRKRKKINKVVQEARSYLGTPYRYGGLSRNGIDCSGLIYNCYQTISVELPRVSKEQSKVGRKKGWGNVRPGDIVYFKFKKRGEKWFHSGMIVYAGKDDIRFIHASTSRGVVESSLYEDYYRDNVKKFRRVIK